MPIQSGNSRSVISDNIRELRRGPQFQRTKRKFSPRKAQQQAVAIAMDEARKSKGKSGLNSA